MAALAATQAPTPSSEGIADPALLTPEPIDFDKMFDDLVKPDEPVVAKVETPPAPAEPAPVEPAELEPVVAEPAPVEPPKAATDDDILNRFAEIVRARQGQDAPRAQPQLQPQPAPQPVEFYSPEEKTALATFEKDWPDVAKAMAVRERALAQQLVGYVFQEVANTIRPLFSQVQTVTEQSQVEQIHALVPDYAAVREPVLQWIEQQPTYLKPAYEYVRDHGTAVEVADLIARFKQATGAAPAPQPVISPVARAEEPSLPAAARKAVASLAPVGSKRSVVVQGDDPSNFDAAFESFASKLT